MIGKGLKTVLQSVMAPTELTPDAGNTKLDTIVQALVDPQIVQSPATPIQRHIADFCKTASNSKITSVALMNLVKSVAETTKHLDPSQEDAMLYLRLAGAVANLSSNSAPSRFEQIRVLALQELNPPGGVHYSQAERWMKTLNVWAVACQLAYRLYEPRTWGSQEKYVSKPLDILARFAIHDPDGYLRETMTFVKIGAATIPLGGHAEPARVSIFSTKHASALHLTTTTRGVVAGDFRSRGSRPDDIDWLLKAMRGNTEVLLHCMTRGGADSFGSQSSLPWVMHALGNADYRPVAYAVREMERDSDAGGLGGQFAAAARDRESRGRIRDSLRKAQLLTQTGDFLFTRFTVDFSEQRNRDLFERDGDLPRRGRPSDLILVLEVKLYEPDKVELSCRSLGTVQGEFTVKGKLSRFLPLWTGFVSTGTT